MTTIIISLVLIAVVALIATIKNSTVEVPTVQHSTISSFRRNNRHIHAKSGKWITKTFPDLYEADLFIQTLSTKFHLLPNNSVRYYRPSSFNNNLYSV